MSAIASAGSRHAFETYLCVFNVKELEQGVYRYLPLEHALLFEKRNNSLKEDTIAAALSQSLCGESAVR